MGLVRKTTSEADKHTASEAKLKAYPKAVHGATPSIFTPTMENNTINDNKILELISRRQRQIIVHSVLYYRYDTSLVSDATFDAWSRELVALQKAHPTVKTAFYEDMCDFDGCTGYHLAAHPWGISVAERLLRYTEGGKRHEDIK